MIVHPLRAPVLLLLAALAATGCSETTGNPGELSSDTANKAVVMGNFAINTGPVVTNEDGKSKNVVDDYVLPAQLPNVNFEVFTVNLLAPTADDVVTDVGNVRVRVLRSDGVRTANIVQNVEYAGEIAFQGQRYDVYRINGLYNSLPAINRTNFSNVTFELDLAYETLGGTTITVRPVTLSVYQRI